jgi:formylglycine-generating enzyme required for sulfatase activity
MAYIPGGNAPPPGIRTPVGYWKDLWAKPKRRPEPRPGGIIGLLLDASAGEASDHAEPDASPSAPIRIEAFCLDRNEVTVADYEACVRIGRCRVSPKLKDIDMERCNYGVPTRLFHPINCISWNDAQAYCEAQGKRLPRDEEWDYAAMGGDARWPHSWEGDGFGKACLSAYTRRDQTCAVRTFPAEWFGLFDMGGNVGEYTERPCTDDDPCDLNRASTSGPAWDDDPMVAHPTTRGAADGEAIGGGIRCAK